jgi:hypothetical protein
MPRDDSRDRPDPPRRSAGDRDDFGQTDYSTDYGYDSRRRAGYRVEGNDSAAPQEDYGQADYSRDYGYDPSTGRGYRRFSEDDPGDQPASERRSFVGGMFGPRGEAAHQRRGPSDRVLWAIIVERLEDERRLDLRHVDVAVENGEVFLNGYVRRKEDKRRIEDVADIEGVRNVQNNLRVRERGLF